MPVVGEELIIPFIVGGEEETTEYKHSEKEILGTVANIRYHHLAFPWDSPLSFGVQAFIEYNGLVMNDRYQSDLIRVVSITGLDDAEVRDSREAKAGKSGEWAYDSFYGGRNLILNGFIEAGSLQVLNYLVKNLKAAFAPLEESSLKFRWFDIYDTFDDPDTILEYNKNASLSLAPSGNYTPFIGNINNLKVEGGILTWKSPEEIYVVRTSEKRTYCDFKATLSFIIGTEEKVSMGLIGPILNEENYVKMFYENNGTGTPFIEIAVLLNGEGVLTTVGLGSGKKPKIGQQIWLRACKEANLLTLEYWEEEPNNNGFPFKTASYNLVGEYSDLLGDEVLTQIGFGGKTLVNKWNIVSFKIESMYPGDVEFQARKLSPLSIKDEQTSLTRFKRSFQIAMKTSDFRAFSSAHIAKQISPTSNIESPIRGRAYPRSYPIDYRFLTSTKLSLESNLLSINNRGSVYVEPILYLYGPGENILIENLTNEQGLEWLGKINENDYIEINCKEETIFNSLGTNYLEFLEPTVEWIKLEPMWNDLYIQGSGFTSATKFLVRTQHGFM